MSRVSRRDHTQTEGEITYKLYISNNSAAIEQMTKCALGQVFTSVQTVPISKTGMITFKFEVNYLSNLEKQNKVNNRELLILLSGRGSYDKFQSPVFSISERGKLRV